MSATGSRLGSVHCAASALCVDATMGMWVLVLLFCHLPLAMLGLDVVHSLSLILYLLVITCQEVHA